MPLRALEVELRLKAKERIASGDLACAPPSDVWGAPGSGNRCSLCEKEIGIDEVDYEVSLREALLHFHIFCHGVWQLECAHHLASKKLTGSPEPLPSRIQRRSPRLPLERRHGDTRTQTDE